MGMDLRMLAYCGLYCEQCSARAAFIERDAKHLDNLPAQYKARRLDFSDYDCEGCKGHNLCGPCRIKDCAVPKSINSCAECANFPCPILAAFENDGVPHHRQAIGNLRSIRDHGVDAWFATIEPTLRCRCGERQSWYYSCEKHK